MSRHHLPRGFQPTVENLEDRCVPATLSLGAKLLTDQVIDRAPAAILIGMLRPVNPPLALPAVQRGWLQVGPQPEPPTKALPAVQRGWAQITPIPDPPTKALPAVQRGWAQITPVPEPPNKVIPAVQRDVGTAGILIGMLRPVSPLAIDAALSQPRLY